jgi:hypothetical protein
MAAPPPTAADGLLPLADLLAAERSEPVSGSKAWMTHPNLRPRRRLLPGFVASIDGQKALITAVMERTAVYAAQSGERRLVSMSKVLVDPANLQWHEARVRDVEAERAAARQRGLEVQARQRETVRVLVLRPTPEPKPKAPPKPRPRLTHCRRGHLLDTDNVYSGPNGDRRCRICGRERNNRRKEHLLDNPEHVGLTQRTVDQNHVE